MDKEFKFWVLNRMTNVTLDGNVFFLARYDVEVDAPRPGKSFYCIDLVCSMRIEIYLNNPKY